VTSSVYVNSAGGQVYTPASTGSPNATFTNASSAILYLGGADVTATSGFPLPPGATINLANAQYAMYAIAASVSSATTTTLSAAVASGASSVAVTSATGIITGKQITVGTGANAETVLVTNVVSTTISVAPSLRQDHASGAAVAVVSTAVGEGGSLVVTAGTS
jgi:hypothetical protein